MNNTMDTKPNPAKAAKEKRERMLKTFFKMHPKEKKFWHISELADFAGNKCTLDEILAASSEQEFQVKLFVKPEKE